MHKHWLTHFRSLAEKKENTKKQPNLIRPSPALQEGPKYSLSLVLIRTHDRKHVTGIFRNILFNHYQLLTCR